METQYEIIKSCAQGSHHVKANNACLFCRPFSRTWILGNYFFSSVLHTSSLLVCFVDLCLEKDREVWQANETQKREEGSNTNLQSAKLKSTSV